MINFSYSHVNYFRKYEIVNYFSKISESKSVFKNFKLFSK
ncbi:unnamed protein product, partial [Onchocerca ochengi]|uniref:Uncharacterized protein n=1 Tax=Onchocerca ochengi TaxID=42157 RepID=A0A182EIS2_ONCOC